MSETPGYETRDMNIRFAALVLAGTLALLVVTAVALWFIFQPGQGGTPPLLAPELFTQTLRPATEPALEHRQTVERARLEKRARQHLNSYGWIDGERGIAHIPIAQAMQLYVKYPPKEAPQPAAPANPAPGEPPFQQRQPVPAEPSP